MSEKSPTVNRPKRACAGRPNYCGPKRQRKTADTAEDIENIPPTSVQNPAPSAPKKTRSRTKKTATPEATSSEATPETTAAVKPVASKKNKKKRTTKLERINEQLEALGVDLEEGCGNCVRAGIYKGLIKFTGDLADLDQVIFCGKGYCGHNTTATLRQLLQQPDYGGGGDYFDLQKAVIVCDEYHTGRCDEDDMGPRGFITNLCCGKPKFDHGRAHHHCLECPKFGKCIGDFRDVHCEDCGKHYFGGRYESYECDCKEDKELKKRKGVERVKVAILSAMIDSGTVQKGSEAHHRVMAIIDTSLVESDSEDEFHNNLLKKVMPDS